MNQINLDQKLAVVKLSEHEEKLLALTDNVLGNALENDDLDSLGEALQIFRSLSKTTSLTNAKLLYGINQHWKEFTREEGDTFIEWAKRSSGYSKDTIKKNIAVWEFLTGNYIPKDFRDRFNDHTMKQLTKEYSLCVTPKEKDEVIVFIKEDYGLKRENWLALTQCVDDAQTIALVQELKGKERNENYITFKIDNTGGLWFFTKKYNGVCGQLFIEHETELVKDACRRFVERYKVTEFENV